jgi:hypothetical protein
VQSLHLLERHRSQYRHPSAPLRFTAAMLRRDRVIARAAA